MNNLDEQGLADMGFEGLVWFEMFHLVEIVWFLLNVLFCLVGFALLDLCIRFGLAGILVSFKYFWKLFIIFILVSYTLRPSLHWW